MRAIGAVLIGLAAACGGGGAAGPDATADDGLVTVAIIPSELNRDLDVLFVIDDSGSAAEEQLKLAAALPELLARLATLPGGLPDLHIGVTSMNVGSC